MSIVIVGGHDRMHCKYKEICKKYGCKCKVFTQCPANFKNQIGSPDMVIVFTGTVAHKMVSVASGPTPIWRRCIMASRAISSESPTTKAIPLLLSG